MGQGGYVIAEWDSVTKQYPEFQTAFVNLENKVINHLNAKWAPKKFGSLTPNSDEYGRTTILPALFDDLNAAQMAHWRQTWDSTSGHQTIITGSGAGNTIPEDFVVAWLGLAFPNKNQHVTEIKFQIGDKKYGRIDLEEMRLYNKPAIIFTEGFILDEEEAFDLYGYIEPGEGNNYPQNGPGGVANRTYQRIVPLGAAYYKVISKVLGNCGAVI